MEATREWGLFNLSSAGVSNETNEKRLEVSQPARLDTSSLLLQLNKLYGNALLLNKGDNHMTAVKCWE